MRNLKVYMQQRFIRCSPFGMTGFVSILPILLKFFSHRYTPIAPMELGIEEPAMLVIPPEREMRNLKLIV